VAAFQRVPKGVAGRLGLASLTQFDSLLEVRLHLLDATGMHQIEVFSLEVPEADRALSL
jgi:hypothetical protein